MPPTSASISAPVPGGADAPVSEYADRARAAGRRFLADVDDILDIVREGREESESQGSVPVASVEAMTRAGFFRALTPEQYGGLEMAPAPFFDGIMKVAACDSSAAWIGGQLNVHSWEIALMDKRAQDEFWAGGPDTRASSSYAPTGQWEETDGGYLLNGTWAFSSGIDHATWVIIGGGDRNFLVRRSDGEVDHDSWDVAGLKGTGSKSITLTDVFVPDYRTHVLMDTYLDRNPGWEVNDGPLYRLPFATILAAVMTNPAIGTTLGGLDRYIADTRKRRARRGTGASVTENPHLLVRLAGALSVAQTMRERHLANWETLFDIACEGRDSTPVERMKVRFESADAIEECLDAVYSIWPVAGAAAILSANPLQQVVRDLLAMRVHGSAGRDAAATLYAQALLGLKGPSFEDEPTMRTLAYYR